MEKTFLVSINGERSVRLTVFPDAKTQGVLRSLVWLYEMLSDGKENFLGTQSGEKIRIQKVNNSKHEKTHGKNRLQGENVFHLEVNSPAKER